MKTIKNKDNKKIQIFTNYEMRKNRARDKAIEWQLQASGKNYSCSELSDFTKYFEKIGRKYGLLKEFRENGIC